MHACAVRTVVFVREFYRSGQYLLRIPSTLLPNWNNLQIRVTNAQCDKLIHEIYCRVFAILRFPTWTPVSTQEEVVGGDAFTRAEGS